MGTAVSNPASFSSLRSACTAEGRGSSTNLGAYYRGGSHVPSSASAGISTSAAGLQLSQFNGVTIPSLVTNHTSSCSHASINAGATTGVNGGACTATTAAVSVSITSGGSGSYTYSWAHVSGDTFTLSNAAAASTTFAKTAGGTSPATQKQGVYRCTITDTGNSNYQTTHDVTVTTTHEWIT